MQPPTDFDHVPNSRDRFRVPDGGTAEPGSEKDSTPIWRGKENERDDYKDQPVEENHFYARKDPGQRDTEKISPCNIGFFELPLREFLRGRRYHLQILEGKVRHKALLQKYSQEWIRSISTERRGKNVIDSILFRLDPTTMLWVGENWLRIYAMEQSSAEKWKKALRAYCRREMRRTPNFALVAISINGVIEERVEIPSKAKMSPEKLRTHYGGEFLAFHSRMNRFLRKDEAGLIIFQGPPGTGKTSLLRHQMVEMWKTHVFYVIPPEQFSQITAHHLIEFQRNARHMHEDKILVLVVEDGEQLVLPRAADNHSQVSNLLNLVSGFLGDYLRVKIVVTLNTTLDQIDPALLRPGRLHGRWEFAALEYAQAEIIAQKLRLTLPERRPYTLAEIYRSAASGHLAPARQRIGFCSS